MKLIIYYFLIVAVLISGLWACQDNLEEPTASFEIQNNTGIVSSTFSVGDTVRFVPNSLIASFYAVWPGDSLHVYDNPMPYINPEDSTDLEYDRGFSFNPENGEFLAEYNYKKPGQYMVVMVVSNVNLGKIKRQTAQQMVTITE